MFCFLLVVLYYLISIYRVSLTYQYTNKAFSVELRTIFCHCRKDISGNYYARSIYKNVVNLHVRFFLMMQWL